MGLGSGLGQVRGVGARRAQLLGEADGDEAVVRVGPLVRVRVGVRVWG